MLQLLQRSSLALLAVPALLLVSATVSNAADEKSDKTEKVTKGHEYTLKTCAVDDKALGDAPVTFVYKGHEIKVCNDACKDAFMKDPDKNLEKVEKAEKAEKKEEKAEKKEHEKTDK